MLGEECCEKIPVADRKPITEREYQEWRKKRERERKVEEEEE